MCARGKIWCFQSGEKKFFWNQQINTIASQKVHAVSHLTTCCVTFISCGLVVLCLWLIIWAFCIVPRKVHQISKCYVVICFKSTLCIHIRNVLGSFENVRNMTIIFIVCYVRLSVFMQELLSHWMNFDKIWCMRLLQKYVFKIKV